MCADAKMMRLLAAEIRAEISARKHSHHSGVPASIRKAVASAAAALGLMQPPRDKLLNNLPQVADRR